MCDQHSTIHPHEHSDHEEHNHTEHNHSENNDWQEYFPAIVSGLLLLIGILLDNYHAQFFNQEIRLIGYLIAYLPVGFPVLKSAFNSIKRGDIFNEFFLMGLATIGAFGISEYPEGVAVMLFYTIGELFQGAAVKRAKGSIKALLDVRPDKVSVKRDGKILVVNPAKVTIGEIIQVKSGEKVALDGIQMTEFATYNTAALTGESMPETKQKGEMILAGMINLDTLTEIQVNTAFKDTKLSKILEMVQNATARKSQTQLFISKFAKIYTPIVFALAVLISLLPYFFIENYLFQDWLYRALVFLVISCPCALVVSIPLGYFGGIGAASHHGILFKGANFLDVMTKVNVVVMDKTGTLTKGNFKVQQVEIAGNEEKKILEKVALLESKSSHPVAKAIVDYVKHTLSENALSEFKEISGHGLIGKILGDEVMAGNLKLLKKYQIPYPTALEEIEETIVVIAINKVFIGYILIADEIKMDAKQAIENLQKLNIKTVMLSGDKNAVVAKVAKTLNMSDAFAELLPEYKVQHLQTLKDQHFTVAFVGDGINDAPVIALSDVGIAMGGMGADASIETADVVIQNDQPSKIVTAIHIAKATKMIVWQNISLAFGVKVLVLILGAGGLANMWEAVFADVGVALLAILNAVRIQRMKF
ncbi:heavy metal translocating P-type ATPase [Arcicella lustrica]|uniref:P-type Zn(2+) transporter n=1 Tax=Arcicella lustrica TaxID=2984196 RepID=A0ABU5SH81_9BACT|nr:heavy metal translocating P-type ATPase [Arcicella sp. DC25W]MEA5426615.1 heavy metal translocating P-type ATPase [Arcicella sp. DC25W]